jgi:cytoskeletal protein CcmA (bactofilin family)
MKKDKKIDSISTFLGSDTSFEGTIEFQGTIRVVMGEVNGTIDAKERIEVYPPGRLGGNVQAAVISIEPGAIFNGNCAMKTQTTSAKKTPAPPQIPSVSTASKGE